MVCGCSGWSAWASSQERQTRSLGEDSVIGDQVDATGDCRCRNPPIRFVKLLRERMAALLARIPQLSASPHQRIIGLSNCETREVTLQPSTPKFAPLRFDGSVPQFSHRCKGDHDWPQTDEAAK